jgi:hypothetical protein
MADDITSYALNLAFQLQAGPAIASLGDISAAFTSIKKDIENISVSLAGSFTQSLSTIQEKVSAITISSTAISDTTTKLETDLAAIQRHYEEIDKVGATTAKTGLKSFLNFDKIRKWVPQLLKEQKLLSNESKAQAKQQEQIGNAIRASEVATSEIVSQASVYAGSTQSIVSAWKAVSDVSSQSLKQGKGQIAVGDQVAAAWVSTRNAMAGAAAQGKEHIGIGGAVAAIWTKISSGIRSTIVDFASMLVGIQAIKSGFTGFVEEENKFNTANYRLYGQQKEIIGQVNKLTVGYKLMRRPAMEAMNILGASIRDTDEQLAAMVNTNVVFSKVLGVNQKDLADWQRAMKSMGIKDADAILMKYANTMRQLGMTAQQMNSILNTQAKSAAVMKNMFGPEGSKELNQYTVNLVGIGNKIGMSSDQVAQLSTGLNNLWANPETLAGIQGMGAAITEAYNTMAPAERAKADLDAYVAKFNSSYEKMNDPIRRQIAIRQGAARIGMDEQAFMALRQLQLFKDSTGKQLNLLGKSSAQMEEIIARESKRMRDAAYLEAVKAGKGMEFLYNEATSSISDRFSKMWTKIQDAWSNFFIAIQPAMIWLLNWVLEPLIDAISWVVNLISGSLTPAADQTASALKNVGKTAEPVVGWLERTHQVLGGLGLILSGVAAGFVALAAGVLAIGVGMGVWWLFMRITDATKLMAIALAAIAVGGGIFLLSLALANMAKIEWSAYFRIAFGLAAITAATLLLGTVGWAGVAAMIALGAASVALGFAVLMLSWAFDNVVNSIVQLLEGTSGADLVVLGVELAIFGVELIAAATTIGIGGLAMSAAAAALGVGMGALSIAMLLISDSAINAIDKLSDGRLQRFDVSLESLAPGIASFIGSMGTGLKFSTGMRGLAVAIDWLDPYRILVTAQALSTLGRTLEMISNFSVDNLSGVGSSVISFANSLVEIFDALKAAVDRVIVSLSLGLFGVSFVIWQLYVNLTNAFLDLLYVIPTITNVTDAIASAVESGQGKIRSQIDALQASFLTLETIASKLGVTTDTSETDKKKVMAETISTIQVKTETSGSASNRWKQEEMQQKQIEVMNTIAEAVEKMGINNLGDVGIIKTLLQTYLPKLGESPSKLSTRLNNWT